MRTRIKLIGVALLAGATALLVVAAVMKPAMEQAASQRPQTSLTFAPHAASGEPAPSSAPAPTSASPTPPPAATLRFAAVGDAITQADSPDFAGGQIGQLSWAAYATSPTLAFSGGWAVAGATTAKIAANVRPLDVDALVIVAGTNDLTQGLSFAQTTANLDRIVSTVGAKRVVVSTIPPRDSSPRTTSAFNASLRQLAAQRHWVFVDAAAGVRDGDVYALGMTLDGVQPTQEAARIIGKAIAGAITG